MIRGDISMISKDYAEAYNKFLKSYDPKKWVYISTIYHILRH